MKIGIDLRPFFTGSKFRGIGMYSRNLIKELLKLNEDVEYHCLNMYGDYSGDPVLAKNCYLYNYYTGPQYVDVGERQLLSTDRTKNIIEAEVRHFIYQSNIDIMFFTSPNEYGNIYEAAWFEGVPKVAILYDLIPLIFPDQCLFDQTYREDYERSLDFLKSMDLLLAISQSAKEDAVRLLGISEERIKVIHAGIDEEFRKLEKIDVINLKQKYGISDPFIMFAGGIDFKKNLEGLITAYSQLPSNLIKRFQFVITGKADEELQQKFLSIAKQNGVEGRVICTGYIPKKDLIEMYNVTEVFVFPSLYEGFGLPVIEAMACGARVITSNVSSLKEIAEGYALLVDPKSIKSITKALMTVLNHPIEAIELADHCVAYAHSYTWEKVAQKTYEEMCQLQQSVLEKKDYIYQISDMDLRNIAKVFSDSNVLLTEECKQLITDELVLLETHTKKRIMEFKKRILYDVTVVEEWIKAGYTTGIARVSCELYKELMHKAFVIPIVMRKKNNKTVICVLEWGTWREIQENLELNDDDVYVMPELQLRGIQVDRDHPSKEMFRQRGIKCYAMMYDILPLRMPEYFEKKTSEAFRFYIKEIVKDFDGILCDSQWVADDIMEYCKEKNIKHGDHEVQVGYFHLGPNSFEKKKQLGVLPDIQKFMNGKVFIMVGTIEPRKGHKLVLDTFEKLWKEGYEGKLCFAGHVGWNMMPFVDYLKQHPEKGRRLEFFEGVNDSELEFIYRHATALIQASAGEGFGLPLIEAGHYQVPIICSDIEVFHEVAGSHVIYFSRNQEGDLKEKIELFCNMQEEGMVPDSGKIVYETWEQVAKKVYDMVCDGKAWYGKM